jgi:uncharacterized membrane protein
VLVSGIIVAALLLILSIPIIFVIAFIVEETSNDKIQSTQIKQSLSQENYWRQNR